MRDLVVREALKAMAADAAERLRELVAAGEQIPYEVVEAGGGSPLPQYVPLTERFIGDHAASLVELDSFGAGCAAIESAGLAGPYLEVMGVAVPGEQGRRAELAGIAFLCRLWQESTDFSLDGDRLTTVVAELEAGGEAAADEIEVVVPVRGLQLPVTRLELATATLVRADTVEVPAEARAPEGSGVAGWEPVFLAATRVSARPTEDDGSEPSVDAGARAVAAFRQLITTLRMFKGGSVTLGPYAWTRAGADRWRRIATGGGRSRPGSYRLGEDELGDLVAFSRTLAFRSTPFAGTAEAGGGTSRVLARSVSRFEAGLERGVAFEALNDHLLALRFLLEGSGPTDLGLSIRVAALCAEPSERGEVKAIIDRGLALERELWSGESPRTGDNELSPAETAEAIEHLLRAILRDAACGHLGSDLRSTADEILLADGLAVGEGNAQHRGGAEEWEVSAADEAEPAEEEAPADSTEPDEPAEPWADGADATEEDPWIDAPMDWEEAPSASEGGATMKVPEPEGRIRLEPRPRPEERNLYDHAHINTEEPPTAAMEPLPPARDRLEELLRDRPREREPASDRLAYLFPRPETTEWDVRELSYDRRRRARVRTS